MEGTPYVGPIMKTISRGFRANANGMARVQATVDLTHDSYSVPILPLEIRMLEIHGKTVDGVFQPTVPVAGGMPMLAAGRPNMAMGSNR